jgi:hypothetical protein
MDMHTMASYWYYAAVLLAGILTSLSYRLASDNRERRAGKYRPFTFSLSWAKCFGLQIGSQSKRRRPRKSKR